MLFLPAPCCKNASDQATSFPSQPATAGDPAPSVSMPTMAITEDAPIVPSIFDANTPEVDEDKQEFDDRKVQKQARRALEEMALQGVVPTSMELSAGQMVMHNVHLIAYYIKNKII